VGDGNNVLHSLAEACAMLGIHLTASTPARYRPNQALWAAAARMGKASGAKLMWESDPKKAARGADVIYTDVWASMGKEHERAARQRTLRPYQVNADLMAKAGDDALFMHCLPAHRGEEVTDEVLDGPQSVIWDEAENRLHAQKGILAWCLE